MSQTKTYKFKLMGKRSQFNELDRISKGIKFVYNQTIAFDKKVYQDFKNGIGVEVQGFRLIKEKEDKPNAEVVKKKTKNKPKKIRTEYDAVKIVKIQRDEEVIEIRAKNGWLSEYDLSKFSTGTSKILNIPSDCIQAMNTFIATAKSNMIKSEGYVDLRFKNRRSRPWIPFKNVQSSQINMRTGKMKFNGMTLKINIDRDIEGKLGGGSFVKEADGWYICVSATAEEEKCLKKHGSEKIGIDLGIKTAIVCSDGTEKNITAPGVKVYGREFKTTSEAINILKSKRDKLINKKKAGSKTNFKRIENISKKIRKLELYEKRTREMTQYNIAHELCDKADSVFVGDVSGKFIQIVGGKKTKINSVGLFRERLKWICKKRGVSYLDVGEFQTSMKCSSCGHVGEKKTLEIREWTCSVCGTHHDRDVNAAINIRDKGVDLVKGSL